MSSNEVKHIHMPRILIAGMSSGCGKTTFTGALLHILAENGINAAAFKCGPDYIDKMFHRSVTGKACYNLDSFFMDRNELCDTLARHSDGSDIAVIEGVMGYYDGTGEDGLANGAYEIAGKTDTPVVLLVNAGGSAISAIAAAEGFINYNKNNITAVVFNNTTAEVYDNIRRITQYRWKDKNVRPAGFIPVLPDECVFKSRHLGLITAHEIDNLNMKIKLTADIIRNSVDIEGILDCAAQAEELEYMYTPAEAASDICCGKDMTVAVASDEAFCFYYEDNLELIESMGFTIKYFSPLNDEPVPDNACGLIIGGGYPENYAERLSNAQNAKQSIRLAIQRKVPCIAECGGFMYICSMLDDEDMAGVLDARCYNSGRLVRFGYVTLTAQKDTLLLKKGQSVRGHEFHYYDSSDNGNAFRAVKTNGRGWDCVHATDRLYAGFPHLYFTRGCEAVRNFANACREYMMERTEE